MKGQYGKFLNRREDSITEVNAYDDMNIISHHALNNHYSDINNQQTGGKGYAKQTASNTLDASSRTKVTSNDYLPTDDYQTSRNVGHHNTLDHRFNQVSLTRNLNNMSVDHIMPDSEQLMKDASENRPN